MMRYLRQIYVIAALTVLWGAVLVHAIGACKKRDFGHGSVVCVCDADHCDTLTPLALPPLGYALVITSTKDGARWKTRTSKFIAPGNNKGPERLKEDNDVEVEVDRSTSYQRIIGFGGAFTDAAGLNILSLPKQLQEQVLRSYYSVDGLEYNLGRVPVGGTDFSTHPYTFDDLQPGQVDPSLTHFNLANEDLKYKIPLIQRARALAHPTPLKLFGSAWGAPGWMKDNGKIWGQGKIKPEYLDTWAKYHIRFLESYQQHNLTFWGLTTQNEPTDGLTQGFNFNAVGFTAEEQADWVGSHLGPALHSAGLSHLQLMILDDNRFFLPSWADQVMSNNEAAKYVSGVAVHWYTDWITPTTTLDLTHTRHPNLFLLYTEACTGQWPWQPLKVVLGSWVRAEEYAADIIEALQHWVTGWTDWNLALDTKGGPNWVKNFVDAPIIINAPAGEFYKQPMYYALAHFTKFLPEGSLHIGLTTKITTDRKVTIVEEDDKESHTKTEANGTETGTEENEIRMENMATEEKEGDTLSTKDQHERKKKTVCPNYGLSYVAFTRPDDSTAVILLNKGHVTVRVGVRDSSTGGMLSLTLGPHTITTIAWRASTQSHTNTNKETSWFRHLFL